MIRACAAVYLLMVSPSSWGCHDKSWETQHMGGNRMVAVHVVNVPLPVMTTPSNWSNCRLT